MVYVALRGAGASGGVPSLRSQLSSGSQLLLGAEDSSFNTHVSTRLRDVGPCASHSDTVSLVTHALSLPSRPVRDL